MNRGSRPATGGRHPTTRRTGLATPKPVTESSP